MISAGKNKSSFYFPEDFQTIISYELSTLIIKFELYD